MNWKRLIAGCFLGIAALALVFWKADLSEIISALGDANSWWIAAMLLALGVNLVLRSVRWAHLLTPMGSFSALRQCFSIYIISYATNILIPLRAGDVVRAILFGSKFAVSKSAVLTSVAIEHLFDGLAIVIIFSLAVGAAETKPAVAVSVYLIGSIALLGLAAAYVIANQNFVANRLLDWIDRLPISFAARISRSAASALTALQLLRDIRGLLWVTVTTVAMWSCSWVVATCIMHALSIDLPWYAALLVIAVANLGFMVPAVPGNIGVAHLLYVSAIVWFGVDLNVAFAFALLLHGIPHFVIVAIGLFAMWYEGLSLRTLPNDK